MKRTALIAEDNEGLRKQYAFWLREADFEVTSVSSTNEALEKLSNNTFDLAITDIDMNGQMGGIKVAGLRAIRYPKTIIIVITGLVGLTETAIGQNGVPGAAATLLKPVDQDKFLETVAKVLDG